MNTMQRAGLALSIAKANVAVGKAHGRPRDPDSLTSRIAALELGCCLAEARKVDPKLKIDNVAQSGSKMKQAFRNNMTSSVMQATLRTGHEYSTEANYLLSSGNVMYLVVIVTRDK